MSNETFRELINRVLVRVPDTMPDQVKRHINDRYRTIQEAYKWSWLEKESFFQTSAVYSTGTINAIEGSVTITGSATTFTAAGVGWLLKLQNQDEYYYVDSIATGTSLTVDAPYIGSTVSGATYAAYKTRYTLATDVDRMQTMWMPDVDRELVKSDISWFNAQDSARQLVGTPQWFAFYAASSGTEVIELLPMPDAAKTIRYRYTRKIVALTNDSDTILAEVRADVLVNGAVATAFAAMGRDLSASETARAAEAERMFRVGLSEMRKADLSEARPRRVKLHGVYTQHREARASDVLSGWSPWSEDADY